MLVVEDHADAARSLSLFSSSWDTRSRWSPMDRRPSRRSSGFAPRSCSWISASGHGRLRGRAAAARAVSKALLVLTGTAAMPTSPVPEAGFDTTW
jgi:hypothetical protein